MPFMDNAPGEPCSTSSLPLIYEVRQSKLFGDLKRFGGNPG